MSTNLVIVESPGKVKSIKKYLGKDFEVLSKVLLDGLRLGRRLHDNEIGAQSRLVQRVRALFEDQVFHLRISGFLSGLAE